MENINNEKWKKLVKAQNSRSEIENKIKDPEKINSYFFIYDCFNNKVLFVNDAFQTVTGYVETNLNLDIVIEMIHPDDRNYFFECEERNLGFTNKLLFNEHFKYSHSFSYRIKIVTGEYIRVLQQCQALEVNSSGHLIKNLISYKRIEYSDKRSDNDFKIFDKSQNIYIDAENRYNLTKREFEILQLIKNGLNSQQVSEKLNISKNTILTHRKNILNKTSCNSFIELVKKLSYIHE